jgi:hypothetical protein
VSIRKPRILNNASASCTDKPMMDCGCLPVAR